MILQTYRHTDIQTYIHTDRLSIQGQAVDEVLHRGNNQRAVAGVHHI